ncbi:hypothetical protein WMY93_002111 [Mugilogobius chulae]|uniref:Uncharacterized protein n=1 Tax=Mugilogobius chulae TaxID=88201 RepID=A0AAW0PTH3_9GOBI
MLPPPNPEKTPILAGYRWTKKSIIRGAVCTRDRVTCSHRTPAQGPEPEPNSHSRPQLLVQRLLRGNTGEPKTGGVACASQVSGNLIQRVHSTRPASTMDLRRAIGACMPLFVLAVLFDITGIILLFLGIFANLLGLWLLWYLGNVPPPYDPLTSVSKSNSIVELARKFSQRLSEKLKTEVMGGGKKAGFVTEDETSPPGTPNLKPGRVTWGKSTAYVNKGYEQDVDGDAEESEDVKRSWTGAGASGAELALWPQSKEVLGSIPSRLGVFLCGVCVGFLQHHEQNVDAPGDEEELEDIKPAIKELDLYPPEEHKDNKMEDLKEDLTSDNMEDANSAL